MTISASAAILIILGAICLGAGIVELRRRRQLDNEVEQQPHEIHLIYEVIERLKKKPQTFSAKWFSGKTLDKSIQDQHGVIHIMTDTGQIIKPFQPNMTEYQKEEIRELIKPIVKEDIDSILARL